MSYLINNQQNINEIVFANRNKNYGAYAIRTVYGNTVFKSLAFMILGFGTIMSVSFYLANHKNSGPDLSGQVPLNDSMIVTVCDLKKEEILPQKKEPVSAKKEETASSSSKLQKNMIVDSLPNQNDQLLNKTLTLNTGSVTGNESGTSSGGTGTSTSSGTLVIPNVIPDPIYAADSNPEFEGGLAALYQFLGSKLVYPELAKEVGKEGTVYVRFVVDQTGKVSRLSLLNKQGYGLDEEAMRVVAMIPKFKSPGMVNNKPVSVYFQLPIKFKLK